MPGSETIDAVGQIGVRVEDDLHQWLTKLAQREHGALNGQIVHALERYRAEIERDRRNNRPRPMPAALRP